VSETAPAYRARNEGEDLDRYAAELRAARGVQPLPGVEAMTSRAISTGDLLLLLAERSALELAESAGLRPAGTVDAWMQGLTDHAAEQVATFDRLVQAKLLRLEKPR
jgi:hypothetical protein